MKLALLILLILVLPFSVGIVMLHSTESDAVAGPLPDFGCSLPETFAGWSSEDIPLGPTEAQSDSAMKTLNMDEFVQRRYVRNQDSITVYAAYWLPGKMDTRLIASHTPDRCWVENGWKCLDSIHDAKIEIAGTDVKPSEFRIFEMNKVKISVYYWLVVNGEVYTFGDRLNSYPSPWQFAKSFFREMLKGKPELYFIRISTTLSKAQLDKEPLFAAILNNMEETGIASKAVHDDALATPEGAAQSVTR